MHGPAPGSPQSQGLISSSIGLEAPMLHDGAGGAPERKSSDNVRVNVIIPMGKVDNTGSVPHPLVNAGPPPIQLEFLTSCAWNQRGRKGETKSSLGSPRIWVRIQTQGRCQSAPTVGWFVPCCPICPLFRRRQRFLPSSPHPHFVLHMPRAHMRMHSVKSSGDRSYFGFWTT